MVDGTILMSTIRMRLFIVHYCYGNNCCTRPRICSSTPPPPLRLCGTAPPPWIGINATNIIAPIIITSPLSLYFRPRWGGGGSWRRQSAIEHEADGSWTMEVEAEAEESEQAEAEEESIFNVPEL